MKAAVKKSSLRIRLSDKLGSVSAIEEIPERPLAMLIIAHGAGAGMNHPFLSSLTHELNRAGIATFRFNFHYMENGKGRPDPPALACMAVSKAQEKVLSRHPGLPLFAGGKSFGGRMTSTWLSEATDSEVKGLVFFGFPLHPPGKPSLGRADHLKGIQVPMLFLQGTKDDFATQDLLHKTVHELHDAELIEFQGADHSFKMKGQSLVEQVAGAAARWLKAKSQTG